MIRVVLADDHHVVRQGIRSLLEKTEDIEIVAEAENGQEAIELVRELTPDVLVMDISMPRLNGIQAAEQIRILGLPTRVVILSMHSDETLVRRALGNGAKGYLLKRSVSAELLLAVRAAGRGETFLSPAISESIVTDYLQARTALDQTDAYDRLSPREREVLKLTAEGYTYNDIAEALCISAKTVEKYRARLTTKLNVQDLAGLIRIALKYGLISLEE